jgi:hypothetical protein
MAVKLPEEQASRARISTCAVIVLIDYLQLGDSCVVSLPHLTSHNLLGCTGNPDCHFAITRTSMYMEISCI